MKTIKKDECSYSVSNAIRTLAMVDDTGLELMLFKKLNFSGINKLKCFKYPLK